MTSSKHLLHHLIYKPPVYVQKPLRCVTIVQNDGEDPSTPDNLVQFSL